MAAVEVQQIEQPAAVINGTEEKVEEVEKVAEATEQPAADSEPANGTETAPAANNDTTTESANTTVNGEEVKKQKSLRFRMPKNLRNLFAKNREANGNGNGNGLHTPAENGQNGEKTNGHKANGHTQNGHETIEEAKAHDGVSIGCAGKMRNVFKKVKPTANGNCDKRPIDKCEDAAKFVGEDYAKKDKLAEVVKSSILDGNLAENAAICTFDGLITANGPAEFQPTVEQVKHCVQLLNGKSEEAIDKTFKIGAQEYVCSEFVEASHLVGKQQVKAEESTPAPATENGDAPKETATPAATATAAGILVQLSKAHAVIATFAASTQLDDVKTKLNEVTKQLREEEL